MQQFPEIDQTEWFPVDKAEHKLHKGLRPLLADFLRRGAER
jgi:predicted NUDIX family NTP pyrophosphohydrolase